MAMTTVRLPPETERDLNEIARRLDRSKGWVINQALVEYFSRQRLEQQRWQETLEAVEAAAEGRVVDSERVHEWLRSWGAPEEQTPPERGE